MAEDRLPAVRVDFAGRPARVFVPVIVEPVDGALRIGHPHQLWNGIRQRVELALAGLQRGFRALALGDLFRGNVDADDLTGPVAMGMPIGDPEALVGLIGALTGHLDAGHGIAGSHDRLHDAFDRIGQRRHTIPDRAPQMVLNGNAAYFGQALIDLKITAIKREESQTDRRGIIDQLQRRLLSEHLRRKRGGNPVVIEG